MFLAFGFQHKKLAV